MSDLGPAGPRNLARATTALPSAGLNVVDQAVVATDLDGKVLYWNHAAEHMYGLSASDTDGREGLDLLVPEALLERNADVTARLQAGDSWSREFQVNRRDGTICPVQVTDSPLHDRFGRLVGTVAVATDATGRRRDEEALRASEELFRGIVETALDGIWTTDAQRVTTFVNQPLAKLLGYSEHEMLGRTLEAFLDDEGRELMAANIAHRRAGRDTRSDVKFLRKDGRAVWAQVATSTLFDQAGREIGALAMIADVTERRRAEAERARLAAIIMSSDDAIFGKALDGIITSWNRGAERLYGYSADEIIGQSAACLAPVERAHEIFGLLECIARGERVDHFETVRVCKDGRRIDVSVSISPIRDGYQQITGAATIARDITDQRRVQHALRDREAQLAESQRIAHIGSWELDLTTERLTLSDEHYRIFGVEPGPTAHRLEIARAIHPDDLSAARADFESAVASRSSYSNELRVVRPDGTVRWIHNRCMFVADGQGEAGRMVGTVQDMTEQLAGERQRMQLTAHVASLLASTSEGIFGLGPDGCFTFVNSAGAALLGYRPDELVGQPWHATVHYRRGDGTPFPIDSCALQQAMLSGVPCQQDDVFWRRDGMALPVEVSANPLVDQERAAGLVVAFRDLSDRRRSEATLKQSEERLRLALDIAGLGTFDWDLQHDSIVWSETLERMVGLRPGTFGGTLAAFHAFVHVDDRSVVGEAMAESMARDAEFKAEFRIRRVDGLIRWMATSGQIYRDPNGRPIRMIGVNRDVTEQKQAEHQREAMAQSEKLRALGQMASGIAHDLNQSLMLVTSYSDLALQALMEDPPDLSELADLLTTSSQAALDGGESVKRLLLFTRASPRQDNQLVDLSSVVFDAAKLTAPRWRDAAQAEGRPINLEVHATEHPTITGSPSQLRELMTNVIFNAVDALPVGGSITLGVRAEDGQCILEVSDSGVGMSPEVQARVFEPFFTTKGANGTGLGLAMVFGIVEQHGGHIQVHTVPGQGTTFRMTFPLATASPPGAPRAAPASHPDAAIPLRVLVVDDEPMMTKAVVRMLRPSGHVVSVAGSGEEALGKLTAQTFDVVVSDLGMGAGMNGWELAEAVRQRWPGVRFMLATGWGAAIAPDEAQLKGVEAVLSKPYRPAELIGALATASRAHSESA